MTQTLHTCQKAYDAGVKLARKDPELTLGEVSILARKQEDPDSFISGYFDYVEAND